jgi:ferric-dicitrate binding protein FerR (iron transport regulator)
MNQTERSTIEAALARLLEGEPEPDDGPLLARAMEGDPALCREVSGLLAVDDLLRQNTELSGHDFSDTLAQRLLAANDRAFVEKVSAALPIQRPAPRRGRRLIAGGLLATAAAAALAFFVDRTPRDEVATLLLADPCTWKGNIELQEGTRLPIGPLRLQKGLAVLRFDGGAELILRDETELSLESASEAKLLRGQVVVRASDAAAGFRLHTPAGDVVDLGTEFAAKVEGAGAVELHVTEGEVALNSATPGSGQGEVLHAGKAVRFDDAAASKPRDVQLSAERFDAIIRSAHPAPRADLMLAYEGFSYLSTKISTAAADGGRGWRGSWRQATKDEAYREVERQLNELVIVPSRGPLPWPVPDGGQPGMLEIPVGQTSLARTLATPLALDRDGVFYFSFIVHEPASEGGLVQRPFGGIRLVFQTSGDPADGMLSFGPTRTRLPAIRTGRGSNFTSPLQVARDQQTLWIGKITARRQGEDEIFFSIFGERNVLDYAEPAIWQVATRGFRSNARLDTVLIAGQLSEACAVDELRVGPTWRSIAPIRQFPEVP